MSERINPNESYPRSFLEDEEILTPEQLAHLDHNSGKRFHYMGCEVIAAIRARPGKPKDKKGQG